jgi:hypothetical protein
MQTLSWVRRVSYAILCALAAPPIDVERRVMAAHGGLRPALSAVRRSGSPRSGTS